MSISTRVWKEGFSVKSGYRLSFVPTAPELSSELAFAVAKRAGLREAGGRFPLFFIAFFREERYGE